MIRLQGYIQDYDGEVLTLVAPFPSGEFTLSKQGITDAEIILRDGRQISNIQRRHIYACLRDISDWCGHLPEETKQILKYEFIARYGGEEFSLSDCDMTTAREFLTFLIEFCVENGVPCKESLLERCEDISKYIYFCLLHKQCCICGKKEKGLVHLHHHETKVGMGRDRTEIVHKGMFVLPLCGEHHDQAHGMSVEDFNAKWKLYGIELTTELCEVYGLESGE